MTGRTILRVALGGALVCLALAAVIVWWAVKGVRAVFEL